MRVNKAFLIVLFFVAILFVSNVTANNGVKEIIDEIKIAILDLQEKILSLENTPSDIALLEERISALENSSLDNSNFEERIIALENNPSDTIYLEDANGQNLGILLEMDGYGSANTQYITFLKDEDKLLGFYEEADSRSVNSLFGRHIDYSTQNCTGQPLIGTTSNIQNLIMECEGVFYKTEGKITTPILSYTNHATGECVEFNSGEIYDAWILEEIPSPFSNPLAYPLKVITKQ
jgi:hypothetical protein